MTHRDEFLFCGRSAVLRVRSYFKDKCVLRGGFTFPNHSSPCVKSGNQSITQEFQTFKEINLALFISQKICIKVWFKLGRGGVLTSPQGALERLPGSTETPTGQVVKYKMTCLDSCPARGVRGPQATATLLQEMPRPDPHVCIPMCSARLTQPVTHPGVTMRAMGDNSSENTLINAKSYTIIAFLKKRKILS